MKYLLILILLFPAVAKSQPSPLYSQQDCIAIYKADSFYDSKVYDSAINHVKQLIDKQIFSNERSMFVRLFYCYVGIKNYDSAYHYLSKALDCGLNFVYDFYPPILDSDFLKYFLVFNASTNEVLKKRFTINNERFHVNVELIKKIKRIIKYDQAARGNKDPEYVDKSINADSAISNASTIDSLNLIAIKQIIFMHEWPGYKELGLEGDNDLWALVQHADKDINFQETVLKLIEKNVLMHNTNKRNYAYLYDRICVNKGLPQLFGTQIERFDSANVNTFPLQDEINVDYYRYAFNLPPLKEYLDYYKSRFKK